MTHFNNVTVKQCSYLVNTHIRPTINGLKTLFGSQNRAIYKALGTWLMFQGLIGRAKRRKRKKITNFLKLTLHSEASEFFDYQRKSECGVIKCKRIRAVKKHTHTRYRYTWDAYAIFPNLLHLLQRGSSSKQSRGFERICFNFAQRGNNEWASGFSPSVS